MVTKRSGAVRQDTNYGHVTTRLGTSNLQSHAILLKKKIYVNFFFCQTYVLRDIMVIIFTIDLLNNNPTYLKFKLNYKKTTIITN
ncbi:hypothetical protein Hdeb2414_s1116g00983521 [Helianthus debilis subsp. tardiflorus]